MKDRGFEPFDLRWRLAPGVSVVGKGGGQTEIHVEGRSAVSIRAPHEGLTRALAALAEGASETVLCELAGAAELARMHYYIARLAGYGLLEASADLDGRSSVSIVPRHRGFDLPRPRPVPGRVRLDRFAFVRTSARGALVQLPGGPCDLLAHSRDAAALIARLAMEPVALAEAERPHDRGLLGLLFALGFAVDPDTAESEAQRTWEFHDRLFHFATRSYDDFVVRGGTCRFRETMPAPPSIRPAHRGEDIALPVPAAATLARSGPLWQVMEERRSQRQMADAPVGLPEIGEVLYRVARVIRSIPGGAFGQDCQLRPLPSGGAIHELEFYLAIAACDGLEPGFYHYQADSHRLTRLPAGDRPAGAMLEESARAWGQPGRPPHVLVVIASRLPRLAWKYEGIAYRLSLLNAGVALQSLHLVTTDMGLAGSAIGSANPSLFAEATGIDMFEETSVAEFGFGQPG